MRTEGTTARDRSVDVARALAMVAIVVGHVERGLSAALLMPSDTAVTLDRVVYLVHLSTFAYLSGLFVRRSVVRDGPRLLMVRRTTLLVWLYLLWSLIQGFTRVAASSASNTAITVSDVFELWVPEGQLWFLPWLIAVTGIAAVAQPWRSVLRGAVVLTVAAVLAVAVWGFEPLYVFTRGWALLLPFLIGCVVTQSRHAALARHLPLVAGAAVVGTAVWLWIGLTTVATTPTTGGDVRTTATVALGVVGCTAGTVAVLACAALLSRSPAAGLLALVGRRSLEIFLAHIVVTAGTRVALVRLEVTDLWVHLLVGTVLGLVVPLAVASVAERLGWTWLFGLPRLHRDPRRIGE
ncbi:acyltransferase family protein [Nocardioides baculatus]|uniref:Acyltransferase n=1 Tax=Nocardioides baculatus TaxID=2801337 RepID=A0ABS1LBU4_9ACTN|nr:acyltransferase [Nocardioides baculatus]MBL0749144.1 acyltransferase [Nocardioides baculatus]